MHRTASGSRLLRMRTALRSIVITAAFAMSIAVAGQTSRATQTTILVYLIERPIGKEVATRFANGGVTTLSSTTSLVERGGNIELSASMTLSAQGVPQKFTAKGRTYRFVPVDAEVTLTGTQAAVRTFAETTDVAVPPNYFTAITWAPLSWRAHLIRRWEGLGRPATMAVVPDAPPREVTIEARGTDTVTIAGRTIALQRYTVNGVVWGRETVWLDAQKNFAAITTRIHILPMEAVREDLRDALPALLDTAAKDAAADLARMSAANPPVAAGTFALRGATIVNGTGAAPIDDGVIVVREGRIAAVGRGASTPIPAGVTVIDAAGKTIVPGLWDMHAHASQIEWAPAYLAAGVTTVRDMGGERRYLLAMRDAIASGNGLGPRTLLAGLVDGDAPDGFGAVIASTPEQGRAVVDRYHADQFDQMKLYSLLQPEVVAAITARARELKMTVTGHVPTALGARRAIDAGMDQVAHMPVNGDLSTPANAELVTMMARKKVVVDPTAPWGELLGRAQDTRVDQIEPGLAFGPPALVMNYRSVANQGDGATARARTLRSAQTIKALFDAGVPVVAGTDGAVPGYSVLRSIELFAEGGMTPMQALQSATIVPAAAMGLSADTGSITPGKHADLLVLDANPLDDIRNIRRGRWVIANGRLYDVAPMWRAAGFTTSR
jgi:imidazolonepropionase-like amidohydrolase